MKQIALANLTFRDIPVKGDKGNSSAFVLFDTGAALSFISDVLAAKIANIVDADKPFKISMADSSTTVVDKMCTATVDLGNQIITDHFYVMPNCVADVVLGMPTMRKYQVRIDTGQDQVFASVIETKPKEGFPVKDFFKKLFAAINITASVEDVSEDKAVELVKTRVDEIKNAGKKQAGLIYTIPPKLLTAMGLQEDASLEDALAQAAFLTHPGDRVPPEQYEQLNSAIVEREINDLVAKACSAGADEFSAKLYASEREWAISFAREHGLTVAREFIKKRPKVLAIMERLPGKKEKTIVIDETQESINRQLGVSNETLLKYNTPAH